MTFMSGFQKRRQLKKNKYKIDKDAHLASKGVVTEMLVTYDYKGDDIKVAMGKRTDIASPELQLRIARQMENAIRQMLPPYDDEVKLIERLAKIGGDVGKVGS
jgi:hypothetical protein